MERPWLKNYPEGVPATIDPAQYTSVADVIEQSCQQYGDKPAFYNMGVTLTYNDVDQQSRAFAAYLLSLGLNKGDRVAIMMPNLLQYPIALFGILRAGLVVVNTNPLYTARELRHQLSDAGVRVIVVVENFASVLESVMDDVPVEKVITTAIGDMLPFPKRQITNFVIKHVKKMVPAYSLTDTTSFNDALKAGSGMEFSSPELTLDDLSFLQYTGGTTGVAKGAMLTHGNIVANMLQQSAWMDSKLRYGEEVIITALPLYHVYALTCNCLSFLRVGGKNVLITNPRDMEGFVKEIGEHPFTAITGVNTLFNSLLNTPGFNDLDFSTLRLSNGGGMAVQRAVAEKWKEVTGVTLIEGYGLTETSPVATINPIDMEEYSGTIGMPVPSTDVCIMNDAGDQMPQGEEGEICIRGPQVMKGYWQRPEATAEVMEGDWLRTGDIAIMLEDGTFKIVDRKKDMILVSGFNVFPNEIEDVVAMHSGVLEVAAIGIPDEKSGEVVKICVVKKDESLTESQLKAHCKEHLTGYKVPRIVEFFDDLPKTNVGKILRRELREMEQAKA